MHRIGHEPSLRQVTHQPRVAAKNFSKLQGRESKRQVLVQLRVKNRSLWDPGNSRCGQNSQPGAAVQACNPRIWETEAEKSETQNHPWLDREFKTVVDNAHFCL